MRRIFTSIFIVALGFSAPARAQQVSDTQKSSLEKSTLQTIVAAGQGYGAGVILSRSTKRADHYLESAEHWRSTSPEMPPFVAMADEAEKSARSELIAARQDWVRVSENLTGQRRRTARADALIRYRQGQEDLASNQAFRETKFFVGKVEKTLSDQASAATLAENMDKASAKVRTKGRIAAGILILNAVGQAGTAGYAFIRGDARASDLNTVGPVGMPFKLLHEKISKRAGEAK